MPVQQPAGIPGIDCYHGDGEIDFAGARKNGAGFVYAKASEGALSADPMHRLNRSRVKAAGLLFGSYHFFDPKADALHQARFFVRSASPMSGELIPMLDVEVASASVGHDALACACEIKWLCGCFPVLYSGESFYLTHLQPVFPPETTLWIARYGAEPKTPCAFWQWSAGAREPGTPHALDGDVFRGGDAALRKLVIG